MNVKLSHLSDLLLVVLTLGYIFACPYTKVEEGFHVQAAHDVLFHGLSAEGLKHYDHFEFPGVVPRTFIGALVMSAFASPFSYVFQLLQWSKLWSLLAVRIVFALIGLWSFSLFRRAFSEYMQNASLYPLLAVITCTQFHFLFYISRSLPNVFALIIINFALYFYLKRRFAGAVFFIVFAGVVFRCDMILLAAPLLLCALLYGWVSFFSLVKNGLISLLICVVCTVVIDSYFWQRWLWPELEVLTYNSPSLHAASKSAQWGVSPPLWYFTSAIPRAMLAAILFVPLAILQHVPLPSFLRNAFHSTVSSSPSSSSSFSLLFDRRVVCLLVPAVLFVALYSLLPHKEVRFLFPILPLLNAIASVGMWKLFIQRDKSSLLRFVFYVASGLLLVSFFASVFFVYVSSFNYPGAVALRSLHEHVRPRFLQSHSSSSSSSFQKWHVHVANLAAITGVSHFGEEDFFIYNKTEHLDLTNAAHFAPFDYVIAEQPNIPGFELISRSEGVVFGFDHVRFSSLLQLKFRDVVVLKPMLYLLQKTPTPSHG